MKRKDRSGLISAASVLLTLIFTFCMVSVLLSGAGIYKKLSADETGLWETRTCSQFIATKVRQAASPESVSTATFGDSDALIIEDVIEGERFLTYIYVYEGTLRELFAAEGSEEPAAGELLAAAGGLSLTLKGDLLTGQLTGSDGSVTPICVQVRGGLQ
ncbi:MAG: DUF4860 domain-containing protein [Firmicutes bacterium]|nr:DUF4860 domain-containing protein [Bacillota bacterium]